MMLEELQRHSYSDDTIRHYLLRQNSLPNTLQRDLLLSLRLFFEEVF